VLEGQVGGIAGVLEILVGPLKFAAVERRRLVAAGGGLIGSASLPAEANLTFSCGSFRVGAALLASRRIGAVASLARDSSLCVVTGPPRLLTGAWLALLTLALLTLALLTLALLTLALLTVPLLRLAFSAFALTLLALPWLTLPLLTLPLLTLPLPLLTLAWLTFAWLTFAAFAFALLALTLLALALTRLALTRLPAAA
jgi:hypothetical protein